MLRKISLLILASLCTTAASGADLNVLFLGDNGHHKPRGFFAELQPALAKRGIQVVYTDQMTDLTPKTLESYDALLLYANIGSISEEQAKTLLDYVADGKGFVPLHCATYCFRNSKEVVALMGGQFKSHGGGVFRTDIAEKNHPIMKGFGGFESWDETYVHHLHNEENRTVLAYRVDDKGREPWTWVRTHGKGRVFYTAWGHDTRTWKNAGFKNLVERGIRWAAGTDLSGVPSYEADKAFPIPEMTALRKDVKPFEFIDVGAEIPNYTPSNRWGVQGEPMTKMQKPLPAEESLKHLVVPKGFRIELFASDPDIKGKPICMNWDERGRLWVAETYDYPNELQPEGKGRDRIRICEDTNGDGKADKFTVFADKLSIPIGMTFYRGGLILQDGTQTLYLKDTNGDDVADERKVLFTGWSQGDTHGGVSNFQYGLDNWIWAMQGYNNSRPVVAGEPGQTFRNGFFRFQPDGSELEFIRSTNNNTWGLGISEEGIIFGSTANRNPSVYMPIANRYYERVRGWTMSLNLGTMADTHKFKPITDKVRQVDQHGGYTAAAGHALYTARNYPQEYWNRTAFVNGPTGHLVGTFVIKADGSDFRSTNPFNLLASDDEWTAPIMSEVGPDGNVWVIDWYNFIVQHNPTPRGFKSGKGNAYETKLRDKKHGRIYRVVYGDKKSEPMTLAGATPTQLVATLKHPTMLWRKHAQRLLVERGKADVTADLIKLVRDQSADEIGLNVGAIHALWTLHGLGQLDGSNRDALSATLSALKHPSAGVRRNAVQVLPVNPKSSEAIVTSGALDDKDAQVRLAALLALSDLPPADGIGGAIVAASQDLDNAKDRWIPQAITSAAATHSAGFLQAIAQTTEPSNKTVDTARIIAEHYARGGPAGTVGDVLNQLAKADTNVADAVIGGLAKGWPPGTKVQLDSKAEASMAKVIQTLPPSNRGLLVKLSQSWGSTKFNKFAETVSADLLAQLDNKSLSDKQRVAAAQQLIEFRAADDKTVAAVLQRVSPQTSATLATGIVNSIRFSRAPGAGNQLVARFRTLTPGPRATGISVLLSRAESTNALLDGLDKGSVQLSELSLDQKQALNAHPDSNVRNRARKLLKRGGALPNADRQKVLEQLLPLTKVAGDPAAGKEVFKKQCAKCHMHSGEGTRIGPDLTGMAVHPKDELLTHLIDPSRSVEGNFRVYTVQTDEGLVLTGLLASESKTAIELFDAEGKKKVVLRENIEAIVASTKSLMPEGFEKQVSHAEITNLLEFLTQRGKFLPLDMAKGATIASDRGMFNSKESDTERMIFPDWKPKVFEGVPFQLTDPQGGKVANAILLKGAFGEVSKKMPKTASLACNGPARTIHLLSGVSGWGFPASAANSVSMIVRIHYVDSKTEDHPLLNGVHFSDYIRRIEVPKSKFAYALRSQQVRYLTITPKRAESIKSIEFVDGNDVSCPIVMAVTVEAP